MATPRSKGQGGSRLRDALKGVITASRQTSRKRNTAQLSLDIQAIETHAMESGLPASFFPKIIDMAASRKFPEAVNSKLIKALIPETVVPEQAVLKAVSWICTNIPTINTQALLIRWVNLMFEYMDGKKRLHALYGILFYFLDSAKLMPHVCYLLYQLTQREDVRLFRVRRLLSLQKSVGSQPYLVALLALYKLSYPSLVTIAIPQQRGVLHVGRGDVAWGAAIRRVREKNVPLVEVSVNMDTTRLQGDQALRSSMCRPSKRARLEIPAVTTQVDIDAQPETSQLTMPFDRKPVPFSYIKDFADLVENMERVEMPGQIAAVLQNPLLQHAVSCQHSRTTAARFSMWLQHALLEEFINSPDVLAKKQKEQLLHLVIKYSNFLQEGIPACDRFLERYLMTWNGEEFKQHIFQLISRYNMCPYGRLKEAILEPLRCLFFSSHVYFKCQVLVSLTNLLRHFCTVEYTRRQPVSDSEEEAAADRKYMCLFDGGVEEFQPRETIQQFIQFVDRLCCIGLLVEADNLLLINYVLAFFEQVCNLYKYDIMLICLPSRSIVCKMLCGVSAMEISRLCGLLCSYKTALNCVKSMAKEQDVLEPETELAPIDMLNGYITDIAVSLWQYKAFQASRDNSLFNMDLTTIRDLNVPRPNECFSLHNHQAMLGYAIQFLRETQPEGAVVHPNSIKASKKTKQIYLKFLEKLDLHGIVQFVGTFVRRRTQMSTVTEPSELIMEEG